MRGAKIYGEIWKTILGDKYMTFFWSVKSTTHICKFCSLIYKRMIITAIKIDIRIKSVHFKNILRLKIKMIFISNMMSWYIKEI